MLNASSRVNTADVYDHRKTIAMHRRGQGSNEVFFFFGQVSNEVSLAAFNMRELRIAMQQSREAQVTSATRVSRGDSTIKLWCDLTGLLTRSRTSRTARVNRIVLLAVR